MTKKAVYLLVVFLWVSVLRVSAFEGKRKGFILGVGAGIGTTSYSWKLTHKFTPIVQSESRTKLAIMYDFKIGYAPNNHWEIFIVDKEAYFGNARQINGILALAFTKTKREEAPTTYFTGGFGFPYGFNISSYNWRISSWSKRDYAFGLYGGYGYEFRPHISLEAALLYGHATNYGYRYRNFSIILTINALDY